MPHLFRTTGGSLRKPGHPPIPLTLTDGTQVEGIWAGSAQEEKLDWWLRKPGHELTQSEAVAEVAVRDDETKHVAWGAAPPEARLFFVLEPPTQSKIGETYRIAKMVTVAATPAQMAYFHDTRFALFGTLQPDGTLIKIPSLPPPPPIPPEQGELF